MNDKTSVGVLLCNLGTPDEPTSSAVRKYLFEFLHDYRVVRLSRWIWCPILHGYILRFRPRRVAKLYQSIWTDEGSPLMRYSKAQQMGLQRHFEQVGLDVKVELGMSVGSPSISSALEKLEANCDRILVLPLYPQYSSSTTAAVFDRVVAHYSDRFDLPELRFVKSYCDEPKYIQALAKSIEKLWQRSGRAEKLMMSFHGIPKFFVDKGDSYQRECERTAQLLAKELCLKANEWQLTYQSRFGRAEWLKPYTDKTLEQWGNEGIKRVDVVCPGFASDCLETLEEIAKENREVFEKAGGQYLNYIPALNAKPYHIELLAELAKLHAGNWLKSERRSQASPINASSRA